MPLAVNTLSPDAHLGEKKLLVDVAEGYGFMLSVTRKGATRQLQIDRVWQGTDVKNYQFMVAHIPVLLHTQPKDIRVAAPPVRLMRRQHPVPDYFRRCFL